MTNSSPWNAMENPPFLAEGKPSISIRAIFHGYVKKLPSGKLT